jgi:ATP-dependent protease ClpP protease subunit
MMARIELRGVIVPSEYDSTWAQGYIDKGIIIPESRFRSQLAQAKPDEPLDVYVNSPGGSVFAANEMVNAVREWRMATKQPVTVTVGAMAASAASVFAIMVADKIRAHKNAKMMFHGAWGGTVGGEGAHEDAADLLGKINADIKTRLVTRYNMQPETVEEWFAEGRAGWLSVDEMTEAGIASEIIEDASDAIEIAKSEIDEIEQHGLGIAALLQNETGEDENDGGETSEHGDAVQSGDDGQADNDGNTAEQGDDGEAESNQSAEHDGDIAGAEDAFTARADELEAARAQAKSEVMEELSAKIEEMQAKLASTELQRRTLQGERDALSDKIKRDEVRHVEQVSKLTEQLGVANARIKRFLDAALTFEPEVKDWNEAMAKSGGDYAKAAKAYPGLLRQYREQNKHK